MLLTLLALALDTQTAAKDDAPATAAQDARFAAMVNGDATYLETALDASLTYHHSSGAAQTKAARFTDVYESRDGRLRQVAWQNTRLPEPPTTPR